MPSGKASVDVLVVGGGVIGLSVAVTAAKNGLSVRVIDAAIPGRASRVAAGLLAPSLGRLPAPAADAFRKAASGYDRFLASISSQRSELQAHWGVLEVALLPEGRGTLNQAKSPSAIAFSPAAVAARTSDLAPVSAAVLHPDDGWIDPSELLDALEATLPAGALASGSATQIDRSASDVAVVLESGESVRTGHVVIAAGCWSPLLEGLPTRLPITPARGEVLVIETAHALHQAVAWEDGYFVPRDGEIVVGSTFELVGYDARTTDAGRLTLELLASRVIPAPLRRATATHTWAGLRPMTPDKLPIVDVDPVDGRIIYACGHGKNGLLLAGLTAEIVLDLVAGNRQDSAFPFALGRFQSS